MYISMTSFHWHGQKVLKFILGASMSIYVSSACFQMVWQHWKSQQKSELIVTLWWYKDEEDLTKIYSNTGEKESNQLDPGQFESTSAHVKIFQKHHTQ